jgi:uroporphyrin-III C-methyltransferase
MNGAGEDRTVTRPIRPGEVWLVGAGPGDRELMTLKAARLLAEAEVVFHDALVGAGVLDMIAPDARRVSVGKRSGRHSKDQRTINDLIVEAAQAGSRVVRLKGGDPSIFGRSGEEIAALAAAGVRVHVCPGITTACAAAASARASLTLRGLARQLTFVTAHARAGEALELDWAGLAGERSSLAIYMGRAAAPEIARRLIEAGRGGATPAIVAVDVSLPSERLIHTRLDALAFAVRAISGDAPTMLLVGEAFGDSSTEASVGRVRETAKV